MGYVHYSLVEDANRALKALDGGIEFAGGSKVYGELAMRKRLTKRKMTISEEDAQKESTKKRVKRSEAAEENKKAVGKRFKTASRGQGDKDQVKSASLILNIETKEDQKIPFDKKQLYKRVRKAGELKELAYPFEDDNKRAKVTFVSIKEAAMAIKKLDSHVFKGLTLKASFDQSSGIKAHRLIIRNLPFTVKSEQIREAFTVHGKVLEISLPMKNAQMARGFAFVQFEQRLEAAKALEAINGTQLAGRLVAVDWAVNKTIYAKALQDESSEDKGKDKGKDTVDAEDEDVDVENDSDAKSKVAEADEVEIDVENDSVSETEEDTNIKIEAEESGETRTVFIRNVSFATEEADLFSCLSKFGPLEYCKIVRDAKTGVPKGSAFAKFKTVAGAQKACVASQKMSQDMLEARESEREALVSEGKRGDVVAVAESSVEKSLSTITQRLESLSRKRTGKEHFQSLVQMHEIEESSSSSDTKGVVVDGRALSIVPAVDRKQAAKLRQTSEFMDHGPQDRRNLSLLNETSIKPKTAAARKFWPAVDIGHHEEILKERRRELKKNPNLFVSKTRLSIRHLPATIDEADLKRLFRTAVQRALLLASDDEGFPVINDQLLRPFLATNPRPLIKQAKVIRDEARTRSKGYAFVEMHHHLHALLAVRYLSNYDPALWREMLGEKFDLRRRHRSEGMEFRAKAPVVEFATEKAAAVNKRNSRH